MGFLKQMTESNTTQNEIQHETTLFAEPIFSIGNFTVTNSLLNSWVSVFILVIFFVALFKKGKNPPAGGGVGVSLSFSKISRET